MSAPPPNLYIKKSDGSLEGPVDHTELVRRLASGELSPTAELYNAEDNTWLDASDLLPTLNAALNSPAVITPSEPGFVPPPRPQNIAAKGEQLLRAALEKDLPAPSTDTRIRRESAYLAKLPDGGNSPDRGRGSVKPSADTSPKQRLRRGVGEGTQTAILMIRRRPLVAAASVALVVLGVYGLIALKEQSQTRNLAGSQSVDQQPGVIKASANPGGTMTTQAGSARLPAESGLPSAQGEAIGKGNNPVERDLGATALRAQQQAEARNNYQSIDSNAEQPPIAYLPPPSEPPPSPPEAPAMPADPNGIYGGGAHDGVQHYDAAEFQQQQNSPVQPPQFGGDPQFGANQSTDQPTDPAHGNGNPYGGQVAPDGTPLVDPNSTQPITPPANADPYGGSSDNGGTSY